jgi:hypothetical protein
MLRRSNRSLVLARSGQGARVEQPCFRRVQSELQCLLDPRHGCAAFVVLQMAAREQRERSRARTVLERAPTVSFGPGPLASFGPGAGALQAQRSVDFRRRPTVECHVTQLYRALKAPSRVGTYRAL